MKKINVKIITNKDFFQNYLKDLHLIISLSSGSHDQFISVLLEAGQSPGVWTRTEPGPS